MFAYTFNLTKRFTLDKILAYCKGRLIKEKMEDEILKIRSQTAIIWQVWFSIFFSLKNYILISFTKNETKH